MKKIGFLGCGKIGQAILNDLKNCEDVKITFIQDPFFKGDCDCPVVQEADEALLEQTDLVIEGAMADVLKENADKILKYCDLMAFSPTAFADQEFLEHVKELMEKYRRSVYIPHGAILGLDGIFDGKDVIESVRIETTKNPKGYGRTDTERTVVYEGSTRGACGLYPRNVNVHATVALAGIGFDKTTSVIISDPAVTTNAHVIYIKGQGISFTIDISSQADGGVTGKYTPYSAVGSVHRILMDRPGFTLV